MAPESCEFRTHTYSESALIRARDYCNCHLFLASAPAQCLQSLGLFRSPNLVSVLIRPSAPQSLISVSRCNPWGCSGL